MLKPALTILAVAALIAPASASGTPVATVDGRAIERQVFDHWLTIAAKASYDAVPDPDAGYRGCVAAKRRSTPPKQRRTVTDGQLKTQCRQDYAQLRDMVMQLLISFEWIDGEAVAQGLTVTEAELTQSYEEQKQQSFPREADFRKFIRESGQTVEDIRQRVRLDLLSNKIRDKVVAGHDQVSEQAIQQFYDENRAQFAVPEQRSLRIVLTKRAAEARRARAALERGASWQSVARRYSIDTQTKRKGGKLPAQAEGTLERTLDKAVFKARKGRLGGPVRTEYGYYVFTVTKIVPARQPPLAEVKETIEQTLVAQAQQAVLDAFVKDFTTRWRAKTECAEGYKTSDCRNGPAARARRDP